MIDYLSSIYNTREVPLTYAVRKDYTRDVADMTREGEILHHISLNVPMSDQVPKKVMRAKRGLHKSGQVWSCYYTEILGTV